jgi:hypothetical protein
MDLHKAIQELYEEKERIDQVIASLEAYLRTNVPASGPRKRGRKSMSAEERQEVSERMRNYWAARRDPKSPAKQSV